MSPEEKNIKERLEEYSKTRDVNLRNEIVEHYLYVVDILVKKYLNRGVEYEDLYQVGCMALIMAVERFDPSKGFEFSSFATPTIIGEIKRYFRDKGWAVKVPAAEGDFRPDPQGEGRNRAADRQGSFGIADGGGPGSHRGTGAGSHGKRPFLRNVFPVPAL